MFKLTRLMVAPALGLVLSLSMFSSGVLAQSVDRNAANGAFHSVALQPTNTMQPHDGPSPVYNGYGGGGDGSGGDGGGGYGNGGYGGGGYGGGGYGGGGYAAWNHHRCIDHRCGNIDGGASKCVRLTRVFKSTLLLKRLTYLTCKWIKTEGW